MTETGQLIGWENSTLSINRFQAYYAGGIKNTVLFFYTATPEEVNKAAEKAAVAFQVYQKKSGEEKAVFPEAIAAEIINAGGNLIATCMAETALPQARLHDERGRTTGQLQIFADLLRERSRVNARIKTAQPERKPLPKPDMHFRHRPLGSVVVFSLSGFLISTNDKEEMLRIAGNLSGHFTATVQGTDTEPEEHRELLDILGQKVGRLLINGFPAGVEVCTAMVHGTPFPATSNSRTTSVGTGSHLPFYKAVLLSECATSTMASCTSG